MWSNNIGIVFSNHPYAEVFQDSLADNKYGTHVFYLGITSFFFLHEMLVKLRSVSHFQKLLKRQENFIKKRKLLRKHVLISEVTMLI